MCPFDLYEGADVNSALLTVGTAMMSSTDATMKRPRQAMEPYVSDACTPCSSTNL